MAKRKLSYTDYGSGAYMAHDAHEARDLVHDMVEAGLYLPLSIVIGVPEIMTSRHAAFFKALTHPNGSLEYLEIATKEPTPPSLGRAIRSLGFGKGKRYGREPYRYWIYDPRSN